MMIKLIPGTYVVAVSGGVDSVALLHMLRQQNEGGEPPLKLVVAHLDHGIREDSADDRKHVQTVAETWGLPFTYHEARLGAGTSEAEAREHRYDFLHQVRQASGARGIITAHHQDDVLETAIINLLRGTGRRGLSSLTSRHDVIRPLLDMPKRNLIAYAKDQGLVWREDPSNQNLDYLRNYVRHRLLPRFDDSGRAQMLEIVNKAQETNHLLDTQLINLLHLQPRSGCLDRFWFNHLPHKVALEVMATWLRSNGLKSFDRRGLERLVIAAKVGRPGRRSDVLTGAKLQINDDFLALELPNAV